MEKRVHCSKAGLKSFGVTIAGIVSVLLLCLPAGVHAQSSYLTDWTFFYEGFTTLGSVYGCGVCHIPDSSDYAFKNPYGTAMEPCLLAGGLVDDCALQVEELDSDGDGCLNVDEIYIDSHPGVANPDTCPPDPEDMDLDGIYDDGDLSGIVGDKPCIGGNTVNCDDNCIFIYNPLQEDCDNDGIGNPCDVDDDGDGYDVISAPPLWDCNDSCIGGADINPGAKEICGNAVDENCDTIVQPLDADLDGDGIPECLDNCPGAYNPDQADCDADGIGDVCDPTVCGDDLDGDRIATPVDNCPTVSNANQLDNDGDGVGNACDCDADGDGYLKADVVLDYAGTVVCDGTGQDCVDTNELVNPAQIENCNSVFDDNCDGIQCPFGCSDKDADGWPDVACAGWFYPLDNCPNASNPTQSDLDADNMGDDCDTDMDGDGLLNTADPAPEIVPNGDLNQDGIVDTADAMLAQRIVSGELAAPDPVVRHMADVEPYLSGGAADNVVSVRDVLRITRMSGMGQ